MSNPVSNPADEPKNCPHCGVSLLGNPIPKNRQHLFFGKYYKREIGVECPEMYDGVWHFRCPDCNGTFGGFEERFKNEG